MKFNFFHASLRKQCLMLLTFSSSPSPSSSKNSLSPPLEKSISPKSKIMDSALKRKCCLSCFLGAFAGHGNAILFILKGKFLLSTPEGHVESFIPIRGHSSRLLHQTNCPPMRNWAPLGALLLLYKHRSRSPAYGPPHLTFLDQTMLPLPP